MQPDRAAFRELVSSWISPENHVTCVTRVTASEIYDLAGHTTFRDCVTRVTGLGVANSGHAVRDLSANECVTKNIEKTHKHSSSGHAVTRSRMEIDPEKNSADASIGAPRLEKWIAHFEERAAIREYEGGFPRREAERLALTETIATLGPKPGARPA